MGNITLGDLLVSYAPCSRVVVMTSMEKTDRFGDTTSLIERVYDGRSLGGHDVKAYSDYIVTRFDVRKGHSEYGQPYLEVECCAPDEY